MQELEIKVTHRVSPELNTCTYGGDFWGKDVCPYHTRNVRSVNGHVRRQNNEEIREDSRRDRRKDRRT